MQRAGARSPQIAQRPARCGSGGCIVQFRDELGGRQIAEARMRAHFVVVAAPRIDDDLGLSAREEPFDTQAFVAERAVETFGDAVLPRLTGIDQRGLDAVVRHPLQECAGDELRAVAERR